MTNRVFIGYDEREALAYRVAEFSLRYHTRSPLSVTPINLRRLEACGLLRRPTDLRGQRYDIPSNAPASTEFAISRFMTPILAHSGWAVFVDCDVVFLADVDELFALRDERFAVQVVKHEMGAVSGTKMDGQQQVAYARKNWSSVMLFNCDHPGNQRLALQDVNERPGRDLHRFYWLADSEIGELPAAWNVLVGVQQMPANPKLLHYTLGCPCLPGWAPKPHDDVWHKYRALAGL